MSLKITQPSDFNVFTEALTGNTLLEGVLDGDEPSFMKKFKTSDPLGEIASASKIFNKDEADYQTIMNKFEFLMATRG